MIPNICHFIYGLEKQDKDFLFVYYLAVYSCSLVNNPDLINVYYYNKPTGIWWDRLLKLNIKAIKIDLKHYLKGKNIIIYQHKNDYIKLQILYQYGGIYMDLDTISYKPYKYLLNNKTVLSYEYNNTITKEINGV